VVMQLFCDTAIQLSAECERCVARRH